MNSSQATVIIVATINLALMILFPPHDSLSLWREPPQQESEQS